MTDIVVSFASCQLGIIRIWVSPLNRTGFIPVALLTVLLSANPMLCMTLRPLCRMLVSLLLIVCAVLIALHCAVPVSSLAIAVRSSSARVMLSSKTSSLLSRRRQSVFLTCLNCSCCCRRFCLLFAMALANFDNCMMKCCLLSDSRVGSLESNKMEKALCSGMMLFFCHC